MQEIPLIRQASGKTRSAMRRAEIAFRGVSRKSGDFPYFTHCVRVAQNVTDAGGDRDVICAAYLHDVVEDTDITLEDLKAEFGFTVARLVAAVTKPENMSDVPLADRAALVERQVVAVGEDAICLKAADLLDNMTDLVLDAEQAGVQSFNETFGSGRAAAKIEHYLDLADRLSGRLADGRYDRLAVAVRDRASELESQLQLLQTA